MASITSSDLSATSFSPPPSKSKPTTSAPVARWNRRRSCEATRRQTTPLNPGNASGASAPASKQPSWGSISASVTNITNGSAEHIYHTLYCARGQMENLIKLHNSQLATDRTSCLAPLANQMWLILHTAAYWLMLDLRDNIPKTHALVVAEFATLHEKLLKIGARVVETASRISSHSPPPVHTPACSGISPAPCSPRDPERRGQRQCPCAPFTHHPETPTRSKSTDRPSGKNAMPNCAQNQIAHKIINARPVG